MDGGDAGAGALRTETDRLRRKHQRKGSEYRVRTLQGLSLGGEAAASAAASASASAAAPSSSSASAAGASASAPAAGAALDDYDPRRAAEAEVSRLVSELTALREGASAARAALRGAGRRRSALASALEALEHEGGVEGEARDGMAALASAKADVARLDAAGEAEDAYRDKLDFMLSRARRERIDALALQGAYTSSLAAHAQELDLKRGLLARVTKSREAELAKLLHMQGDVRKTLCVRRRAGARMRKRACAPFSPTRAHAPQVRPRPQARRAAAGAARAAGAHAAAQRHSCL
jgi:hypothetical protein